jgi:aminopeptidase N
MLYPYANEKYGHAQFGWGGGMEHQTMSFMNNFSFGLIAHELAHQWFGDYITLGSWQDIWLNEGFATYMTGLAHENLEDGFWWPVWKSQIVKQVTSQPGGSVFVKDTTSIGTIFNGRLSYSKGAYILHMLRWVLGDENFFKGIQNYFNDPEIANGFARNDQFVKHMEITGDTSLTGFFNDWYYGEGFPIYSAQFAPAKKGVLKIILSQTTSHNSVDFFEMPVPVRLYSFGKTDSLDIRLENTVNNQAFFVQVDFQVAELKIDPDYWLISKTAEIVKVQAIPSLNEMVIYPNPFTDNFSVFVPFGQQIISVRLFTVEGTQIKESIGNERNFYLPEITRGVYFIQIKTGSGIFEQKIVKL